MKHAGNLTKQKIGFKNRVQFIRSESEKDLAKKHVSEKEKAILLRLQAAKAIREFVVKEMRFQQTIAHTQLWVIPAIEQAIWLAKQHEQTEVDLDSQILKDFKAALVDVQEGSSQLISAFSDIETHWIQDSVYQLDSFIKSGDFLIQESSSEEDIEVIDRLDELQQSLKRYFELLLECVEFYDTYKTQFNHIQDQVFKLLKENHDTKIAHMSYKRLKNEILRTPQGPGTGHFAQYFIEFTQRVMRYPLQLSAIKKYLPAEHALFPIIDVLEQSVSILCRMVDERKRFNTEKDSILARYNIAKSMPCEWAKSTHKRKMLATWGLKGKFLRRHQRLRNDMIKAQWVANKKEAHENLQQYQKAAKYFNQHHKQFKSMIQLCRRLSELQQQGLSEAMLRERLKYKNGESVCVKFLAWDQRFQSTIQALWRLSRPFKVEHIIKTCDILRQFEGMQRFAQAKPLLMGLELLYQTLHFYQKELENADNANALQFLGCPGPHIFVDSLPRPKKQDSILQRTDYHHKCKNPVSLLCFLEPKQYTVSRPSCIRQGKVAELVTFYESLPCRMR